MEVQPLQSVCQQQERTLRVVIRLYCGFADVGHVSGTGQSVHIQTKVIKTFLQQTRGDYGMTMRTCELVISHCEQFTAGQQRRLRTLAAAREHVHAPTRGQ